MEPPRVLNYFHSTAVGLGNSLGIGVYVLLGEVVKSVPGLSFEITILLTGITVFLAGLIFTEFSVWFLKANSTYSFFYACGNENIAFVLGWVLILKHLAGTACVVKGGLLFIDALTEGKISTFLVSVVPLNTAYFSPYFDFVSVIIVIIITILLSCGVKDNVIAKCSFTACNLILLIAAIVAGFFKADFVNWVIEDPVEGKETQKTTFCNVVEIVKQAAVLFIGFIGFESIGLSDEETKKRHKFIPAAVFTTLLTLLIIYTGVGSVLLLINPYYKIVPYASLSFAFEQIGWFVFKWILVIGAFLGFQTSLFGILYPLPKIMIAMANDGILFQFLGKYSKKTNTPLVATLVSGFLTACGVGVFTFEQLISLTVISTLFVLTILAINITLFRYTPIYTEEEPTTVSTTYLYPITTKDSPSHQPVTFKNLFINLFNYKQKVTVKSTLVLASGNLFLYGISSIILSLLLIYYFEDITNIRTEIIVAFAVFLTILVFSLVSLICQPKSVQFFFKVPLTPSVPCLSIFLNILFLVSFGVNCWIFFAIWLLVGTVPYLIWYFFKCRRSLITETSIYEINKMNTLKLNEAVWKIIKERPSFYEGTVNPEFRDDSDEKRDIVKINTNGEKLQLSNPTSELKLKRAQIYQTVEIVPEEKTEPLKIDVELNSLKDEEQINFPENMSEKVEWKCVAEIHKEDFSQESVVLEIVDTTYNFLSEDLSKDGDSMSQHSTDTMKEYVSSEIKKLSGNKNENFWFEKHKNLVENSGHEAATKQKFSQDDSSSLLSKSLPVAETRNLNTNSTPVLSKKLLEEIQDLAKIKKERITKQDNNKSSQVEGDELITKFNGEELNNLEGKIIDTTAELDNEEKPPSTEQSKKKEFKEKLNQLLKNQIDINSTFGKSFLNTNSIGKKSGEIVNEEIDKENELYKTVKTLNKAQIKGKLEFLLTKGPPKRPSLKNSFGIKIKKADTKDNMENKDE